MRKKYWAVGALTLAIAAMTILLIVITRKRWREAEEAVNHYEDYE